MFYAVKRSGRWGVHSVVLTTGRGVWEGIPASIRFRQLDEVNHVGGELCTWGEQSMRGMSVIVHHIILMIKFTYVSEVCYQGGFPASFNDLLIASL